MITFIEWLTHLDLLARLKLVETYYSFNPQEYNQLFQEQLELLLDRITDPAHRKALESMRHFDWVGYIAASIRRSGSKNQRELQEKTHDLVSKLLVGTLFRGYDETKSGPMPQRFKSAVANAIRNLRSKEFNRRKYLPSLPISQEFQLGAVTDNELIARMTWREEDREVVKSFRRLVKERLGELALAVLDARLAGQETQSLFNKNQTKKIVQQIKSLAKSWAQATGDQGLVRDLDRAMERETTTVQKRLLTTQKRRAAIEM